MKQITFADFCAGIGGFRLGFERLGWKCVYSCEIEAKCESTYYLNFNSSFDARDINKINFNKLPDYDVLCAGFPCQPFSIAGKRLGVQDERSSVIQTLINIIKTSRPKLFLLENVPNFGYQNNKALFKNTLLELNNLGYDIHCKVLDSAYFGVPQHRPRLFILGVQQIFNTAFFQFTEFRTKKTPFRNFIVHGDYSIPISAKWEQYIDLYTGKKSKRDLSFDIPKTRLILERVNPDADLQDCILQMRTSGIRANSVDRPLPTFAVSHSGGGAMIPVYTKERRHLNLTEIKRIMGFPDEFKFQVARTDAIKQLANAVCPPVIESIGKDIETLIKFS
jgi:DNA (cytosine-5)-methyltransferase 1